MSPTVPPTSVMRTSTPSLAASRCTRLLISLVMCGMTCTVPPRKSPRRSFCDHGVVDAAGGHVGVALDELVDEALVVAQVEVGLGAVVGDEHLAVLEGAHRAGVDVDVRVELLVGDLQAARLEQTADRGGRDALAQPRDDAAGDEDVLSHATLPGGTVGEGEEGR